MTKEKTRSKPRQKAISDRFIQTVCTRLSENKPVRRSLPEWGRVHIDRSLPFLCIYRRQYPGDTSLSERMVMGEASYITAAGAPRLNKQLAALTQKIALTLKEKFGSFLIVEVWMDQGKDNGNSPPAYQPAFKIVSLKDHSITSTVRVLEKSLRKIKIRKQSSLVELAVEKKSDRRGFPD